MTEDRYSELLKFESSSKFSEREKVALAYTSAIIWNSDDANDALWAKLHQHFTVPELVELGQFVGLTLGTQRWVKTLGIQHGEFLADTPVGVTPTVATAMQEALEGTS